MIRRTVLALMLATAVTLGAAAPALAQATYASATLTLTGSLAPGSAVLGQVTGCANNELLTVTLVDASGSRVLGTTTTNAVGSATFNITLPATITYPARIDVAGPRCGLVDSVSLRPAGHRHRRRPRPWR